MKNIIFLLFGLLISLSGFSQGNRFSSLYLTIKPTVKDTADQVLVRDHTTGLVKFRHASTLGAGGGSMSADRIPYWNGSAFANGPHWDNTNTRLGVGGAPAVNLDVMGSSGNVRGRFLNSGSGDVELNLRRTGGTASDWSIYSPSGQSFLSFYSGGEKFRFLTSGVFQILTTPTNDNTNTNLLTWDGLNVETRAVSSLPLTAAGSNTQFQYNNSGVLGASAAARFESGTSLFGNTSTYSVTNETMQITKGHATYSGIEDILTLNAHGTTFGSVTDGFGGQIKLGIAGTAGTVGRTGIFAHSWITVGSTSKVRVGQVVGANPAAVMDFKSDGSFEFYNNATNLVNIDASDGSIKFQGSASITSPGTINLDGQITLSGTGISQNSGGVKHTRVSTGSIPSSSTSDIVVTWSGAFVDTNYTIQPSVLESTGWMKIGNIIAQTASTVTIRVENNDVSNSLTGTLHVIAIHD